MNHQLNSFQERDAIAYIVAQESGGNSSPEMPSATNYTPFVLSLAVFVVVLKGYQRSS